MTQITMPAQVVNGRLQYQQSLAELEGENVVATLTVVPKHAANGTAEKTAAREPSAETDPEFDPEPPPWLDVENDVYFPMTVPSISLGMATKIKVGEGQPCIVLPEELPSD